MFNKIVNLEAKTLTCTKTQAHDYGILNCGIVDNDICIMGFQFSIASYSITS